MRKAIKTILCLGLCLCLCAPALAEGVSAALFTDMITDYDNYPRVMSAVGGKLYLLGGTKLYAYAPGDESASVVSDAMPARSGGISFLSDEPQLDALLPDGDTLYALDTRNGKLYSVSTADGKLGEPVTLDWKEYIIEEEDYSYTVDFVSIVALSGRLYVVSRDYSGNDGGDGSPMLASFDMKTGEKKKYDTQFIQQMCAYKDGKLLALVLDTNSAWDEEKRAYKPADFCAVDAETGEVETLGQYTGGSYYSFYGMSYSAADDTVYYAAPNRLYRMVSFGEPELCAYVPSSNLYARSSGASVGVLIKDNIYAVSGDTGIYVRTLDPTLLPEKSLTIYGGYGSDAHNKAAAEMNDIPIMFLEDTYYETPQELGQALVSGETNIDVMYLSLGGMLSVDTLMEKGYCLDLSGDAELMEYVNSLYPFLRDSVMKDGKLYAIPVESYSYGFGYSSSLQKEMGIEIPTTFTGLCELITKWNDELYEEFPNARPFMAEDYRATMTSMAITLYVNHYTKTGEALTFDTPLFREMLTAVEDMQTDNLDAHIDWETASEEEKDAFWNYNFLFEMYTDYSVDDNSRWTDDGVPSYINVPMSLTDSVGPAVQMNVRVLAVNPKSPVADAAIAYIKAYIKNLSETSVANMVPSMNSAIENPDYEQQVKEIETSLAQTKEQREKAATEAEKRDFDDHIKNMEENLAKSERRFRYLATEDSIAAFRKLMEYGFADKASVIYSKDGGEISDLISRYRDDQIDLESFIRETENKLRLMRLEQ